MATRNMKRIQQAEKKLKEAEDLLLAALLAAFPKGSKVGAILKHGQIAPTPGTVVGISGPAGHMLVRIATAKEGSKRPVRAVYYKNLHEV